MMEKQLLRPASADSIELVQPVVSIVIPTYNHLDLLKACVESIKVHTDLARCEVVIVANGCTDGTLEYVRTLPPPFRYIVSAKPLGFTGATNAGIRAAVGDYILFLNNDTALLEQKKNLWIEMLLEPFKDPKVGITGPAKFTWDCGGTKRKAIAFWCAMIPKKLFTELGLLDEIFNPGMGEDGDFSIKAEQAGYRLVAVPEDLELEFGKGVSNKNFPIYHKGSGTFGDQDYSAITKRNGQILVDRYGRKKGRLDEIYEICCKHPCDLDKLFPTFRGYAGQCKHITEFGVRGVFSTYAFLVTRPKRMVSYDVEYSTNIEEAKDEAKKAGIDFEFRLEDVLKATIEPTELLFIDTKHNYAQTKMELWRHADSVSKYILIHDTETYGLKGDDGSAGVLPAIDEFLERHKEWIRKEVLTISNGLTVLERVKFKDFCKVSIVVPTCGKDWDNVLRVCLEAVRKFTDWGDKELIIVANGCPSEALQYLNSMVEASANSVNPWPMRVLQFPEPIGYIRAVNAGIEAAHGEFVITLDDDSFLQPHGKDFWVNTLLEPFLKDKLVAGSSPFGTSYIDLGQVLHSGCTMYRTAVLKQIGMFDEAYNPGYMSDEDVSFRLRKAGFKLVEVPEGAGKKYVNGTFEIAFPVVHTGHVATMPKHTTDLPLVERNRKLLYERHGDLIQGTHSGAAPGTFSGEPGHPGKVGYEKRVSIIILTYNHLEDLLKPNIDSLKEFTDLRDVEVIVVANGCKDGTEDYVRSLGEPFRVVSFPDPLGFTKATNEGIKVAKGEFLVFYNNDNALLPQRKNQWLDWLTEQFATEPKLGITGPLQLHDDYADADVIIGFCFCVKRTVLDAVGGLLDEVFSPGGGEDIDLCCKVRNAGYIVRQVPKEGKLGFSHTNTGEYPIWHKNNQTFKDIPEYTRYFVKRNGFINMKRYNKNIKLNLGSGGIEYKGYLSVDLHDSRATIIMDATKIDLPENSVSELLVLHLFEHLNPYHCLDTLKGWFKILKPGGKIIMEMPDIEQLCKRFVTANTGERYGILNAVYGSVNTTGEGDESNITSPHLYGWWPQSLYDHLMNAGFRDVIFGPEKYPHPESNLHVEGTKPG